MSVSRSERLQWFGIVALLAFGVAGAIVAQFQGTSGELPNEYGSGVVIENWLPEDVMGNGPRVVAFQAPPTADGLREAARWQIETAQAIARASGYDLWFRDSCSYYYLFDLGSLARGGENPEFADYRLKRIDLLDFETTTARVRLVYFHPRDPLKEMSAFGGQTERWRWENGEWRNETCHYSLGPELWRLISVADPSVFESLRREEWKD